MRCSAAHRILDTAFSALRNWALRRTKLRHHPTVGYHGGFQTERDGSYGKTMSSKGIDAVLFDYGGVFTTSPFAAAAGMAEKLGLPTPTLLEVIFGPYDTDSDHPWHRIERGELKIDEARTQILELGREHDTEVDLYEFFSAIGAITQGLVEPMVECARRVKKDGYRTAIVTNNIAEFSEHWRNSLPLDELFDTVVDSSQVGMRKPNPKIYTHALECLGNVEPGRAIFLDDFHGNITAAQKVGMHGILVEADPTSAIAELSQLLGW